MDNTASFKINRGIVTHLKLFPLFGEYNNTLIWALLANDYIKNVGYTLRQARVITQYKKYKRTVSDVERLVDSVKFYYNDLEYLFNTRLVIYEGDYSEARVHGKSVVPSTVRIIYEGNAVEYDSTAYIYRIYKNEWIPNKSQHQNDEYMYVLIPDHDAFISRFEGMKIVDDVHNTVITLPIADRMIPQWLFSY